MEEKLSLLSTCNDRASELMKSYGLLNQSLIVKPLTEIKEDICHVMEIVEDPLCSTQILDDTEELLDSFATQYSQTDSQQDSRSIDSTLDKEV